MDIKEVIKRAGGPVKLSKALGHKTHTSVLGWKAVPVHCAAKVASIINVDRHDLRPDVWDAPIAKRTVSTQPEPRAS